MENFFKFNDLFFQKAKEISNTELRLMVILAHQMDYNNVILYDETAKFYIQTYFDVKDQQLHKVLKRLEEKRLIFRKGFYIIINQEFASKGTKNKNTHKAQKEMKKDTKKESLDEWAERMQAEEEKRGEFETLDEFIDRMQAEQTA